MKVIAVIPARYKSTRFEGKPLVNLCGKPMIWWVHHQLCQVKGLSEIYVATDDERIRKVCSDYGIKYVMTSDSHINGDEPLMMPEYVERLLPTSDLNPVDFYFANAMTKIKKTVEVADISRIKVVTDNLGYAMYMARTPIPYPKASSDFDYMKFVGIQCFSRSALLFCKDNKRGKIESIEDIDEYRFLENGKKIKFVEIPAETLSVDTQADVKIVTEVLERRIKNKEIVL